jgi:hypothetical protein
MSARLALRTADAALDWIYRLWHGQLRYPFARQRARLRPAPMSGRCPIRFREGAIMRSLSLAVSAGLLALASDAGAQANTYPVTSDSAMSSVQVTAPARRIFQEDLDTVRGQYALSNGWRLKVDPAASGISARIDKQRPIYLMAQSKDKFVSRDGKVEMVFNRGDQGEDMLMSYVPADSRIAQMVVVKATLAQR